MKFSLFQIAASKDIEWTVSNYRNANASASQGSGETK